MGTQMPSAEGPLQVPPGGSQNDVLGRLPTSQGLVGTVTPQSGMLPGGAGAAAGMVPGPLLQGFSSLISFSSHAISGSAWAMSWFASGTGTPQIVVAAAAALFVPPVTSLQGLRATISAMMLYRAAMTT